MIPINWGHFTSTTHNSPSEMWFSYPTCPYSTGESHGFQGPIIFAKGIYVKKNSWVYLQSGPPSSYKWLVVSNIFYFHPYLGKISNLTNMFQLGWNHQLDEVRTFRKRVFWPLWFIGASVHSMYNFWQQTSMLSASIDVRPFRGAPQLHRYQWYKVTPD